MYIFYKDDLHLSEAQWIKQTLANIEWQHHIKETKILKNMSILWCNQSANNFNS